MRPRAGVVAALLLFLAQGRAAPATPAQPTPAQPSPAAPAPAGEIIQLDPDLTVEPLAPGVWRHVSWWEIEGFGRSAANGLLVVDGGEAALVDTPWTVEQTRLLLAWARAELGAKVTLVLPTHAHPDCLGGLEAAHDEGAESWALAATAARAQARGTPVNHGVDGDRLTLAVGTLRLELRHLGAGHTADNSVVWIPSARVLFGGCLVRSATSRFLGYTGEADLEAWPRTIEAIDQAFPEIDVLVPGHGRPEGRELLARTLELLAQHREPPAE